MADAYWTQIQQMQMQQQQHQVPPSSGVLKRPRSDYDSPAPGLQSGSESQNYVRGDDRGSVKVVQDTKSIGSAYDRYLQSTLSSSLNTGEVGAYVGGGYARSGPGTMSGYPMADPTAMVRTGGLVPDMVPNGRSAGFAGQHPAEMMQMPGREPVHLPPDASSTLYVEGLPNDITKREVAHIFRPFVGYKEVRLVTKESKHRNGEPLIFCFVDFSNPACAATAMSALQGYNMDEHDKDSTYLRLQFARNPGPRSGPRPHGRR